MSITSTIIEREREREREREKREREKKERNPKYPNLWPTVTFTRKE